MARLKLVYSNFEKITHLWAHQTQPEARCRNGFFEGDKIYSYGRHFLAGKMHKVNGQNAVVINSHKYSVTTAKQLRDLGQAVSHMPTFRGKDPEDLKAAVLETQANLIDSLMNEFKLRSYYQHAFANAGLAYGESDQDYDIITKIQKFNADCIAIGMSQFTLDVDDEFISLLNSHALIAIERQKQLKTPEMLEKREKERAKREAKQLEKARLNAENWVRGGAMMPGVADLSPQLIRINGDTVETTRGASVPLSHAQRLIEKVLRNAAEVGDRVGHFSVDALDQKCIKIGCHVIAIDQAKAVLLPTIA